MGKVIMGLVALPLLTGVAVAGQPLSNQQMDLVTAGFSATSIADAEGLAGQGMFVITNTATLAEVFPITTKTVGETTSTLYESLSSSTSSTITGLLH